MGFTDQHGFSMIEIVVALALAGIIAAIALPGWRNLLPSIHLDGAARQIQSELHAIKMRAVAENVRFQLAYTAGASAYTIQKDSQSIATKPLSDGIIIAQAGTILFWPRGTAKGNTVRLRNSKGQCKHIVVSATGRVRVCRPSDCSGSC